MSTQKPKTIKDTENTTDGAKKLITTMLMLIGTVLLFIFFIVFIFWLMTKNLFQ